MISILVQCTIYCILTHIRLYLQCLIQPHYNMRYRYFNRAVPAYTARICKLNLALMSHHMIIFYVTRDL